MKRERNFFGAETEGKEGGRKQVHSKGQQLQAISLSFT